MPAENVPIMVAPDDISAVYERRLKFMDEAQGRAAAYDTAITLLGYGGFFGLWTGVSKDVSITIRDASCTLIAISLLLYVGWTIASMLVRHSYDAEFVAVINKGYAPLDEINEWDKVEAKRKKAVFSVNRWWMLVFGASLLAGIGGTLLLIFGAVRVALAGD